MIRWKFYRDEEWMADPGWGFWFRVFGRGVHFSDRPRSEALFSERHGYRKVWYVLGVRIEYLPKPEAK